MKFDVSIWILQRLAELRVAPPLLGSGHYNNRAFVIQQFIDGSYPDPRWFVEHVSEIARIIRRYQSDGPLRSVMSADKAPSYRQHVARELSTLKERVKKRALPAFISPAFRDGFGRFEEQAENLEKVALVPTHADPNYKNFLLMGDQVFMIDWDAITLSDPLRDVGPLLWWYVPKGKWGEFFDAYGEHLNQNLLDRLYCWTTRESLAVALWLEERGDRTEVHDFLEDFAAAIGHKDNPHRVSDSRWRC